MFPLTRQRVAKHWGFSTQQWEEDCESFVGYLARRADGGRVSVSRLETEFCERDSNVKSPKTWAPPRLRMLHENVSSLNSSEQTNVKWNTYRVLRHRIYETPKRLNNSKGPLRLISAVVKLPEFPHRADESAAQAAFLPWKQHAHTTRREHRQRDVNHSAVRKLKQKRRIETCEIQRTPRIPFWIAFIRKFALLCDHFAFSISIDLAVLTFLPSMLANSIHKGYAWGLTLQMKQRYPDIICESIDQASPLIFLKKSMTPVKTTNKIPPPGPNRRTFGKKPL